MKCPNHKSEQTVLATISDGVSLRPELACGCCPTAEETMITAKPAAIFVPPPPPDEISDAPQMPPDLFEKQVTQILMDKGVLDAQAQPVVRGLLQ